MATKYGLAIAAPFVKGTAGSTLETLRRNHNKDSLIHVASSLGWLVRDTLGVDMFKTCLNLVESSPACGGGMERLAKAYRLNRLGPYREGALNAAKMSSEEFVAHMARYGLNSYGEPLEDEEEAAAAAMALASCSQQQQLQTQQGDSALSSQDFPDLDGTPGGVGGDNVGKVSAPVANDDPDRVVDVDDPHHVGNVRAPAATDPLLAGGTVGRSADQSQVQAGSQVQGPADNRKKICKAVWRDDVCADWTCDRAHPPRCGNPMCFPTRRKDCQYWHSVGRKQQQQQQHSSSCPHQQQQQGQRPQRRRQPQQQQQGNGHGAGPGRAGQRQTQGKGSGPRGRRQQQQRLQQPQQSRPLRHPPHMPQQHQVHRLAPPPVAGPPPPLQLPGWQRRPDWRQQQQQQAPSYRDMVARGGGTNPDHELRQQRTGPGGFDLAQHNPAVLSTVVAAVMAVLAGENSIF